jgi:uncharacterized protein YdeI (BOF family)
MKLLSKLLILMLLSVTFTACTGDLDFSEYISRKNFSLTGGSFLSDAEQITVKEVILDNGTLLGREVIIEGKILEKGEFDTFVIIDDRSGRLLVVLTDMVGAGPRLKNTEESHLRVFGTVERGKFGLPFVKAKAFIGLEKLATNVALKH